MNRIEAFIDEIAAVDARAGQEIGPRWIAKTDQAKAMVRTACEDAGVDLSDREQVGALLVVFRLAVKETLRTRYASDVLLGFYGVVRAAVSLAAERAGVQQ